jgi:polysaccharide export outer membrane protein
VVKEGTFEINGSTTVLQMIAEAGGLRDFAKRKSIYILRQSGDQQIRYPFNYEAVIRGRKREQNIRLEPGDTVVVP